MSWRDSGGPWDLNIVTLSAAKLFIQFGGLEEGCSLVLPKYSPLKMGKNHLSDQQERLSKVSPTVEGCAIIKQPGSKIRVKNMGMCSGYKGKEQENGILTGASSQFVWRVSICIEKNRGLFVKIIRFYR